jgi:asparagine synthase (glutamine-hydrolysing)
MIVNNHVHAGAIPESNQRRGWQAVGYPIEHGNSIGHITFYTLARMFGVKVLFSGHGGDEGVTNNAREALDEMIAARQWDLAMRTIGGRRSLQPLRLFKRTQEQRPDPNQGLRDAIVGRLKWSVLKPDVFDEVGVEGRVRAGAAMHDVKPRVNDLALARLLAPHSPIRTSDGSLVAASYGLQYEWPLLDRRLIQQWLSTPTAWKQAEGYGRYLHRAASAPFTPRKVVWKPSKDMTGGQGPDYVPDLEETRASWRDTRERMPAEVADLIDVDKVDRMVEDGQEEAGLPLRRGVKGATVLTDWLADR